MTNHIAFIGVGNMGNPMADQLVKAGKEVKAFDVSPEVIKIAKESGLNVVSTIDELLDGASTVISMLPEGKHVRSLYLGDKGILNKIPILRTIYNGLGQLTKNFTSSNNKSKKIVLLEYPRKGLWSVGFATGDNKGEISNKVGRGKRLINVFVPTTPNPTSGFLLMVPKKDLIFLDMNFEDASKFIMSAGSINPRSK